MEFVTSFILTTLYGSGFVLALEWVSSKYRATIGMAVPMTAPIGEILLAVCAMHFQNFRTLRWIIFTPGVVVFVYNWLLPESTRWLYSTGRYHRAEANLIKIATSNGRCISQQSLSALRHQYEAKASKKEQNTPLLIVEVFRKRQIFLRFCNLSYIWMANAFVYYGIGITTAQMHLSNTNKYISFMMISSAEIPGVLIAWALLDRIGRRPLICTALAINGIVIIASTLIPHRYETIFLILFIIGKCSIICSYSSVYIFVAELWPTYLRHSMMGMCSMIGRLGPALASAVILLDYIAPQLPFILFGVAAWMAAALLLLNPETNGRNLPETFDDIDALTK